MSKCGLPPCYQFDKTLSLKQASFDIVDAKGSYTIKIFAITPDNKTISLGKFKTVNHGKFSYYFFPADLDLKNYLDSTIRFVISKSREKYLYEFRLRA